MDPFELLTAGKTAELRAALAANPAAARAIRPDGATLLSFAVYMGNMDAAAAIRAVLPKLTPNEACTIGDAAALEQALASGWDPNSFAPDGFTPLALTVFFRHPALFDRLLPLTRDVNVRAKNAQEVAALHAAAAVRDARAVEALLKAGADPDLPQAAGFLPIHVAAQHGDGAIAGLLVLFGASVTKANSVGKSAIDHANEGGHAWLAKRLGRFT